MKFAIKTDPSSKNSISLHSNIKKELEILEHVYIDIKIGAFQKNVSLKEHQGNENILYISEDISSKFSLPELNYEITMENGVLSIGPILGIFIRGKFEEMDEQRLKIYKNYLIDYQHVSGLVLLFTTNGIDEKSKTIKGFAYDPKKNQWMEGTYVFPSVVFCRKTVRNKTRTILNQIIGKKYFNSHVFDKWEMWEWISTNEELRESLPETVRAKDLMGVKTLLHNHNTIFLKPKAGMQGSGIYSFKKKQNEYILSYRLNKKNMNAVFDDWEAVMGYLDSELDLDKYIAQQGVSLIQINKRIMDIRVIAQKDRNGKWNVPGMITRFGEKESIVSNISSGGSAETTWRTLRRLFKEEHKEAFKKYKEIEHLAISYCEWLESKGIHLGSVGIDIGLDEDYKLWVIEINNREPDMTIALDANDEQLYFNLKSAPLHYGKWLAGFGGEDYEAF